MPSTDLTREPQPFPTPPRQDLKTSPYWFGSQCAVCALGLQRVCRPQILVLPSCRAQLSPRLARCAVFRSTPLFAMALQHGGPHNAPVPGLGTVRPPGAQGTAALPALCAWLRRLRRACRASRSYASPAASIGSKACIIVSVIDWAPVVLQVGHEQVKAMYMPGRPRAASQSSCQAYGCCQLRVDCGAEAAGCLQAGLLMSTLSRRCESVVMPPCACPWYRFG